MNPPRFESPSRESLHPSFVGDRPPSSNSSISNTMHGMNDNVGGGRMIVGVDFGTTFTSCSFTFLQPGRNIDNVEINSIKTWESFGGKLEANVPSKLYYMVDPISETYSKVGNERQVFWGFGPSTKETTEKLRLHPELKLTMFEWFKLHLKIDFEGIETERRKEFERERQAKRLPPNLTPLEAATDFLRCFIGDVEKYFNKPGSPYLNRDPKATKYVLTVPSIWSQAERDLTKQAAMDAGFLDKGGSMTLIKEPEAAAFAAIQRHTRETSDSTSPGDAFIVCDAGGGTVDLVGYKVEAVQPLRISEASQSTGGFCGSSFLNNKFNQLLRARYPALFKFQKLEDAIMKEFDLNIKTRFGNDDIEKVREYSVELLEGNAYLEAYTESGIDPDYPVFDISAQDLVEYVFGPVIDETSYLVGEQIIGMSSKLPAESIKFVYLVGGFGESAFLQQRLEDDFRAYAASHRWSPSLKCLGEAQQMVTKGAVYYGAAELNMSGAPKVCSKIAQATYGIPYDAPTHKPFPPGRSIIRALNGAYLMRDSFHWALRKGSNYQDGVTIPFQRDFTFPFYEDSDALLHWTWSREITLYTVLGNNPPDYLGEPDRDNARRFCTLTITDTHCPKRCLIPVGRDKHIIKFSISLVFKGASLRYTISPSGGTEVSVEDINYSESHGVGDIDADLGQLCI